MTVSPEPIDLILVTGPSGAGRTTAIHVLEDAGYEVIDNLPLSLTTRLLEPGMDRPLALGIDVRNRDFSVDALLSLAARLRADPSIAARLLYLDCSREVLISRFSETRRRHPMAPSEDAEIGVMRELELISSVADQADVVIDTTALTVHDLKDEILRWFGRDGRNLAVSVQSFSYKRGVPRGLDMVIDVRFLTNPHWVPHLRNGTGHDPAVRDHVTSDIRFPEFFTRMRELLILLLPAYRAEGRAHFAVGFGCTGGRHRSVAVTEMLADALAERGWQVSKRHRELDRRAGALIASGPANTAHGEGAA
ncbi:glmZ(sRNA)-inactivating NTPase [Jannaschia seosinensis]|uniref:GlmZ(SRNA)-inactivating NTPase n=1 Tax=Jannaschia seosinensis TaxID=313367 RepID=A0A0M7BBL3_9RHOB|nr:RNase adapter RapZ [Jannaschia seosinensis]CUH39204.1 glmZ(sRNA)-inactivating NTPase [Jannaschia seosinensis]